MTDAGNGFVVCGESRTLFRTWGASGPEWTPKLNDALWFARRADAERFCEHDEAAHYIATATTLRHELTNNALANLDR